MTSEKVEYWKGQAVAAMKSREQCGLRIRELEAALEATNAKNDLLLADRDRAEAYWKEIAVRFKAERDEALAEAENAIETLAESDLVAVSMERDRLAEALEWIASEHGSVDEGVLSVARSALAGVPGKAAQNIPPVVTNNPAGETPVHPMSGCWGEQTDE